MLQYALRPRACSSGTTRSNHALLIFSLIRCVLSHNLKPLANRKASGRVAPLKLDSDSTESLRHCRSPTGNRAPRRFSSSTVDFRQPPGSCKSQGSSNYCPVVKLGLYKWTCLLQVEIDCISFQRFITSSSSMVSLFRNGFSLVQDSPSSCSIKPPQWFSTPGVVPKILAKLSNHSELASSQFISKAHPALGKELCRSNFQWHSPRADPALPTLELRMAICRPWQVLPLESWPSTSSSTITAASEGFIC